MDELLAKNLLIVLFAVIAVGYLLGRIRIGSFSLGVSAVLFVGLGVSAVAPQLALPEIVYTFGLALFVYTIGIASGPSFVAALRSKGLSYNIFALCALVVGWALVLLAASLLHIDGPRAAGLYAGAYTNTPALAAVLDALPRVLSQSALKQVASEPTLGYSLTYPIGVIGTIAGLALVRRLLKIDPNKDGLHAGVHGSGEGIASATVRVTRADRPLVGSFGKLSGSKVEVTRLLSRGNIHLAQSDEVLRKHDMVTLVGEPMELQKAVSWLGEMIDSTGLELDRTVLDFRRMVVSSRKVAGRKLKNLSLRRKYGIAVTRIRRGDVDMLAGSESVLQIGDHIRVVAPRSRMKAAAELFGDSYRRMSELDILTFSLGLTLGLLLGLVPLPLPGGGGTFHLGSAGGPLVVSLALGALGRTGPLLWQFPFSTNMALRQVGVVLFLAGIGTRAGEPFARALADPASLVVMATGAVLTCTITVGSLLVGYRILHIPYGRLSGMLAALQTQPAVLAYANEQAKNELPNLGYATVYPVAMVAKIILAQLILVIVAKS